MKAFVDPIILDTTLRDGSYTVDFSFTLNDTMNICSGLEHAGIKYIEIGHGIGIGAYKKGHKPAIHSDIEYIHAARNHTKNAKIGMFSIVNMTDIQDIINAANNGLQFIRIGSDIENIKKIPEYIEVCKNNGLEVMCNIMKSYTLPPAEFADIAKNIESYGADVLYVVDSAGGMFPDDIKNYYNAIREKSNITLGFHGHNNLSLAVANTIEAFNCGYKFIDTSLQGLGRSSGNPPTEVVTAILQKQGLCSQLNLFEILDLGQKYIKNLTEHKINDIDIIAGFADFHTSYMNLIYKYSAKYSIDPRNLIIELTKIDKINAKEELVEELAKNITKDNNPSCRFNLHKYIGNEQ